MPRDVSLAHACVLWVVFVFGVVLGSCATMVVFFFSFRFFLIFRIFCTGD